MPKLQRPRWMPDTLSWWVFTVLTGVVILMSALTLAFLIATREDAGIIAAASQATDQVIVVKRMVERDKPEDRAQLIRRFSAPMMRMVITRDPVVEKSDDSFLSRSVLRKLRNEFAAGTDIRVDSLLQKPSELDVAEDEAARAFESIEIPPPPLGAQFMQQRPGPPRMPSPEEREQRMMRVMQLGGPALPGSRGMFRVSVKFAENTWFNTRVLLTVGDDAQGRLRPIIFQTFIALIIAIGALWGVNRAFKPLSLFADAAERLGVDFNSAPLPEDGPGEVRRAAHAFNTMQRRLKRFVEDRTQMLAAISHDLRTPITRLKLRAEFVDDAEQRAKMLRDLDEMEAMIAATLAFSRDDAAREPALVADLAGLIAGLVTDAQAAGQEVTYVGPAKCDVVAKPLSLKRALVNLMDNAVKYGARARVSLAVVGDMLEILIDDDGPGIDASDRERVFAPFVRIEASRSRETGGVGLGLTIARNILRAMGGDIELTTHMSRGLRVRIMLPAIEGKRIAAE